MTKKLIMTMVVICMVVVMAVSPVMAATSGSQVAIGQDNTEAQLQDVYGFFRIERGSVPEIAVTNSEEHHYLEGLVPDEKIGSVALSCAYIETRDSGGIELEVYNINWVTEDMYKNALTTAGITDAKVIVAAYKPVSGTGALTGIYKAYEEITGEVIDEEVKQVSTEELVVTGDLQDIMGEASPEFMNDIKAKLELTKTMSDNEIKVLIINTAADYDATLTDDQVQQILDLIKKMNELGVDPDTFIKLAEAGQGAQGFFETVGNFFKGIGDFFSGLFSGNKD